MKVEPTIELRIRNGFFLKLFSLIITFKRDDWNIGFFKIKTNKSKGFVYYKSYNKFKWNKRKYEHKAINDNIINNYSMGGWLF
jgi:hypothetical protein